MSNSESKSESEEEYIGEVEVEGLKEFGDKQYVSLSII